MKFIQSILLITLLLGIACPGYGQGREKMPERIKSMKVAFFTEQLDLSPEEAEKFWPLYNDYESRKEKMHKDHHTSMHYYMSNMENISDKEAQEMLTDMIALHQEETRLMEEYQERFLEILPPKKVMAIFIAEFKFKRYLLKQLREHRGHRRDRPMP